jgi:cytidylate kinase
MQAMVILLNGPLGIGKSTLGEALGEAIDASVTLDHMLSINRSAAYIELPTGLPWEQGVTVGPGGVSNLLALTDAGTALLLVNCATSKGFKS